jgi:hypothetical protein
MSSAKQEQAAVDKSREDKAANQKTYAGVPVKNDKDNRVRPDLDRKHRGRNGR